MNSSSPRRFLPASALPAPALLALALLLLAAGAPQQAAAQDGDVRAYNWATVPFLRIEPDSRAAGMGNANVALADNVNAIFWNPAGLAFQKNAELGFTHSTWLPEFNADLYYEYLVGKYNVPGIGTFGGHVTFLNLGESERRIGPGEEGKIGEFRSYDLSVGLSYGRKLSERFAIGVGGRFIYSDLADGSIDGRQTNAGKSFALDLSGLYRTRPFDLGGVPTTFSAGANLANMGPSISYVDDEEDTSDPIPTNLRFGYAFTFDFDEYNSLTFANDFNKLLTRVEVRDEVRQVDGQDSTVTVQETVPFYQAIFTSWGTVRGERGPNGEAPELTPLEQMTMSAGLEYWYDDLLALRTGYFYEHPENGNRQFLTFGAGVRYNIVGVDFSYVYALEEASPLSGTMRFSLLVNFAR